MSLALTIFIGVVVVVLGLVGYFRDPRRGLIALLGTLLGVIVVDFWAAQWGAALSRSLGGDPQRNTFIVSSLLFLWGALVVGYGGGLLLGRSKERLALAQRLIGVLFGLLNGVLIVGFLLRYAAIQESGFATMMNATPAAAIIHNGLPLLFLALVAIVTLLTIARGVSGMLGRRAAAPAPAAQPSPASQPSSASQPAAGERRVDDRSVLNKVNDASRR